MYGAETASLHKSTFDHPLSGTGFQEKLLGIEMAFVMLCNAIV
jgi:hypothetical protein